MKQLTSGGVPLLFKEKMLSSPVGCECLPVNWTCLLLCSPEYFILSSRPGDFRVL